MNETRVNGLDNFADVCPQLGMPKNVIGPQ